MVKLRLCEDPAYQEPEVSIVYAQKDVRVSRIVDFVESVEQRIKCEKRKHRHHGERFRYFLL